MIKGRFGDSTTAPYVGGTIAIHGYRRQNVSFLVDTGADKTVLMPADSALLGIDHSKLKHVVVCKGVGGDAYGDVLHGIVTFVDENGGLFTYKVEVIVLEPTENNKDTPSLLGRDIINRWRMYYDFGLRRVEFEPESSDNFMAAKPPKPKPLRLR